MEAATARLTQLDEHAKHLAREVQAARAKREAARFPDDKALYQEMLDDLVAKEKLTLAAVLVEQTELKRQLGTGLKRPSSGDCQERVASEVKRQSLGAGAHGVRVLRTDDEDRLSRALCKELLGDAAPAMPDGLEALSEFLKQGKLPVTSGLQQLLHIRGCRSLDASITVCPRTCQLACLFSDSIILPLNRAEASDELLADVCAMEYVTKMFTELTAFAPAALRTSVKISKSTSVKASCSSARRPYVRGVAEGLLVLAGEVAAEDALSQVMCDLAEKVHSDIDKRHYGSVSFIPVFAASDYRFRWGLVSINPRKPVEWGYVYNVTSEADCVRLSLACANVYRLMSAILRDAATYSDRVSVSLNSNR